MKRRTSRWLVSGAALLLAAALSSACGCARAPLPPPERAAPGPVATAPKDPARTVLYEDTWAGWDVRLLGVAASGDVAVVRLTQRAEPLRVVFDTIDLTSGSRVVRWETSPLCARSWVRGDAVFGCVDGSPDELERHAASLRSVGPWHTRGTLMHPVVSPGPGALAYLAAPTDGRDGDWIRVRRGAEDVRVGRARAAYDPVFGPDGRLVYRVCRVRPGGCAWSLATLSVAGHARSYDVAPQRPPVLNTNGSAAFVVTGRLRDCVQRVSLEDGHVAPLGCAESEQRVRLSDAGGAGVAWAEGDGIVLRRFWPGSDGGLGEPVRVERATGLGAVSESGEVALVDVDGAVVVVGAEGQVRLQARRGRYSGLAQSRFTRRGLIVLESWEGGFALVALRH